MMHDSGYGFEVRGSRFKIQGSRFKIQVSGYGLQVNGHWSIVTGHLLFVIRHFLQQSIYPSLPYVKMQVPTMHHDSCASRIWQWLGVKAWRAPVKGRLGSPRLHAPFHPCFFNVVLLEPIRHSLIE
jgi:hypothetical protein